MDRIHDPATGEIDWPDFRRRIAQAFEGGDRLSPEQSRKILQARAGRLAAAPIADVPAQETIAVLPFRLGREKYGIETRFAREVIRLTSFTAIPGAPDFLVGVANLRGEILPVFDLMRFFGFASSGLMDRSRVIVVGAAASEFGIIADTVQEVTDLARDAFVADSAIAPERGRDCIRGVTPDATIVLDGAALIAEPRLFIGTPLNTTLNFSAAPAAGAKP
jgi:purine-binding chemotaxis protein CheW